jgi:hypothetical protein
MKGNTMTREEKIDSILEDIDRQAAQGWSSNWAEVDETRTALIVTFADGTKRRYSLPVK